MRSLTANGAVRLKGDESQALGHRNQAASGRCRCMIGQSTCSWAAWPSDAEVLMSNLRLPFFQATVISAIAAWLLDRLLHRSQGTSEQRRVNRVMKFARVSGTQQFPKS